MEQQAKPVNWLRVILIALIVGGLLGAGLIWYQQQPAPNRNRLALGEASTVEEVVIPINPPDELDGLSRADIYAWRTAEVQRYPELLAAEYVPADAIFGQIVDGLPWWGYVGQYFYANGPNSIEGASEEARFILNPYYLVHPEFFGMSYYGHPDFAWSEGVDVTLASSPDFVLMCTPESQMRWFPTQRFVEVSYNLSYCKSQIDIYSPLAFNYGDDTWFDLIAYNARDFNLNYVYVDYAESLNVQRKDPPNYAYNNPQFIHQGGSCQYPGGCNNMSPATPEISGLLVLNVPAKAVIKLWERNPASLDQTPDLTYVMYFN